MLTKKRIVFPLLCMVIVTICSCKKTDSSTNTITTPKTNMDLLYSNSKDWTIVQLDIQSDKGNKTITDPTAIKNVAMATVRFAMNDNTLTDGHGNLGGYVSDVTGTGTGGSGGSFVLIGGANGTRLDITIGSLTMDGPFTVTDSKFEYTYGSSDIPVIYSDGTTTYTCTSIKQTMTR